METIAGAWSDALQRPQRCDQSESAGDGHASERLRERERDREGEGEEVAMFCVLLLERAGSLPAGALSI